MTAPTPPPVQVLVPAMLVQGDALRPLYRAVLVGIADARASGYNIAMLVEIQSALRSVIGYADSRKPLPRIVSTRQHGDDQISVNEAAKLLRCGERHVRRLARTEGLGRRVGRAWVLDRVSVLALAQEMERQTDTATIAA
jgi:Helix-turn-helix domain